jgi:hypothetical protein
MRSLEKRICHGNAFNKSLENTGVRRQEASHHACFGSRLRPVSNFAEFSFDKRSRLYHYNILGKFEPLAI